MSKSSDEILRQLQEQSRRLENESYVVVAKALIAAEQIRADLRPIEGGADPLDRVIESQLRKIDDGDESVAGSSSTPPSTRDV
ncbi:hypothetical protein [Chthonobacter albigriseus]|uniref:hypothetical protein n=1 Tax=Chthonobacter albigriseus TaxID=1683161 RepID=UPI0015EE58C8|nr:hypothetical protein [Chthonobacter albigriseus]